MLRTVSPLRTLLAGGLLFSSSVLSLPSKIHIILENRQVVNRQVASTASTKPDWVTVDLQGLANTVTPTITGNDGKPTTYGDAPESLTATGVWTLLPQSATPTTSTGLPPVATAAQNGVGSYLACEVYASTPDAPFCQPKSGTQLRPGLTYFITWSSHYFANTSTFVQLQGTYLDGSGISFTSPLFNAWKLEYAWTIPEDLLSTHHTTDSTLNVTFSLNQYLSDSLDQPSFDTVDGPFVVISRDAPDYSSAKPHKTNVAAIVVPIIVVVLLLMGIGFCVFRWKKTGRFPIIGGRGNSGGEGYGIRQSWSQRTGGVAGGAAGNDAKPAAGVELTDRDSWTPSSPQGRNVFREEVQRQERER